MQGSIFSRALDTVGLRPVSLTMWRLAATTIVLAALTARMVTSSRPSVPMLLEILDSYQNKDFLVLQGLNPGTLSHDQFAPYAMLPSVGPSDIDRHRKFFFENSKRFLLALILSDNDGKSSLERAEALLEWVLVKELFFFTSREHVSQLREFAFPTIIVAEQANASG